MCTVVYAHECGSLRDQKRGSDLQEQELQVSEKVLMWVLAVNLGPLQSSVAVHALNC